MKLMQKKEHNKSPEKAFSDVKWTSSNKNVAVVTSKTNKKVKAKCKIKIYAAMKSMKNQGTAS